MRIDQLKYLVNIAQTKSISQTSRDLFTTRQNVSKILQQIEIEMGVPLFIRNQKGIEFTPSGQLMVDFAQRTLADFSKLTNQMYHLTNQHTVKGELHIYSGILTTFSILPEIIQGFSDRYPDIFLQLHEDEALEVLQQIIKNPNYMGVLPILTSRDFQDIYQPYLDQVGLYPLVEDRYLCMCSKISPLAQQKTIPLAQFVKHPIALNQRLSEKDSHILRLLNRFGATNIAFSSNDSRTYQQAVSSNRYLGLSSQRASHKNSASPFHQQLTTIPFKEDLHFHICLITAKNLERNMAVDAFMNFIRNQFMP